MMGTTALTAVVEGGEILLAAGWAGVVTVNGLVASHKKAALTREREGVMKVCATTIDKTDLPKIFDKDFKASFLTVETLNSIITVVPNYENKYLDQYVRHIMNALGYLYEYHALRLKSGKQLDDITSCVLCWLILNVGSKCVNVTDIDATLVYLQQISKFVNEFASIAGENSRRFKELTRVRSELNKAYYLLKDHSLSLSLTECVKQLLAVSGEVAANLLVACTKLIVPNHHWEYFRAFIPDRLAAGILQYHVSYTTWRGARRVDLPLVELPKSLLGTFIKISAGDYLRSLDLLDGKPDNGDFLDPNKFKIPETINVAELKKAFMGCNNFLTKKAAVGNGTEAVNHLVSLQTPEEMRATAEFFIGLLILLLCAHASRSYGRRLRDALIGLGERYFNTPEEVALIFGVTKAFTDYVIEHDNMVSTGLTAIQAQQENAMMTAETGDRLYTEVSSSVDAIKTKLIPVLNKLEQIHQDRYTNSQRGEEKSHKHNKKTVKVNKNDPLLEFSNVLRKNFGLNVSLTVQEFNAPAAPLPERTNQLFENFTKGFDRINEVRTNDPRADQYLQVYYALLILLSHSIKMSSEKHAERVHKAEQLQQLILKQCIMFNEFLDKNPLQRQIDTQRFVNQMMVSVQDDDSKFLDEHHPGSNWVVQFFKKTFFNTQSRNEANALIENCKKLKIY